MIVGAARTPVGSFRSSLAAKSATDLGSIAVRGAIKRAGRVESGGLSADSFV